MRTASLVACAVLATTVVGCGEDPPPMRVVTAHVRAGDRVVVHFAASPVAPRQRGHVWLTLVPEGSSEQLVAERVVIEEGAAEATIATAEAGAYELRLVDASPRRLSRVVARARVLVEEAVLTGAVAPAWYW
jgi:hypothetical protein